MKIILYLCKQNEKDEGIITIDLVYTDIMYTAEGI